MERLRRKVDTKLVAWKADAHRLPLIVKGARQIGKTEAVEHFARGSYAHVVEINFALQQAYRDIFDGGLTVDAIVQAISFHDPALVFVPHETLIFFDELQACPQCAASLKAFALDGRYDVICSGSLMGISYQEIESNSVGYKEDYTMRPLDFEEFLIANGVGADAIASLRHSYNNRQSLSEEYHNYVLDLFKRYLLVGGLPDAVNTYLNTHNIVKVREVQDDIRSLYGSDASKYEKEHSKKLLIRRIYEMIPSQMENKKKRVVAQDIRGKKKKSLNISFHLVSRYLFMLYPTPISH